jgi:hypothetical protein
MIWTPRRPQQGLLALAVLGALLAAPARASAGDITVFFTLPAPTEIWGRGYGAAISSTWFTAISLEAEAARLPGDSSDISMTSFTGSAMLAPPLKFLVPYGGLGIGVFRQSVGTLSDTGILHAFILGLKIKLGLLVLKGEYRHIGLSGPPPAEMTARITAGAGISF